MFVYAFDPGPTYTGWALLYWDGRVPHYVDGGHIPFGGGFVRAADGSVEPDTSARVRALMEDAARVGGVIAIEQIVGYAYDAKRVQALLETTRIEGDLKRLARSLGITPFFVTCKAARGLLCRAETASDAQVAIVVEALVHGAPKHLAKDRRQHIYDAALYGLGALWRRGVRLTLSPEAETELFRQQAADKAARAQKRVKTLRGEVSPETWKPTREQRRRRVAGTQKSWPVGVR